MINYKWDAKRIFCPIAQNLLLVGPYFQRIIFRPQWPLPIALIGWGLWPPWNFWRLKIYLPTFRPMSIMAKRLDPIDQDTTCYGGMHPPGDIALDGDPASPSTQRGTAAHTFRPIALVRIPACPYFPHNSYCQLDNARRAAIVAILPDNCHPSSCVDMSFRLYSPTGCSALAWDCISKIL